MRFDPTASLFIALAVSVLLMSIGAIALLLMMIRHGEVSRVAALIYLVPPLTAIEAFLFFGESLGQYRRSTPRVPRPNSPRW